MEVCPKYVWIIENPVSGNRNRDKLEWDSSEQMEGPLPGLAFLTSLHRWRETGTPAFPEVVT